jgi:hypothetical protein
MKVAVKRYELSNSSNWYSTWGAENQTNPSSRTLPLERAARHQSSPEISLWRACEPWRHYAAVSCRRRASTLLGSGRPAG